MCCLRLATYDSLLYDSEVVWPTDRAEAATVPIVPMLAGTRHAIRRVGPDV